LCALQALLLTELGLVQHPVQCTFPAATTSQLIQQPCRTAHDALLMYQSKVPCAAAAATADLSLSKLCTCASLLSA
jgi:hypothetical protein